MRRKRRSAAAPRDARRQGRAVDLALAGGRDFLSEALADRCSDATDLAIREECCRDYLDAAIKTRRTARRKLCII
jgi:hypothetical protein